MATKSPFDPDAVDPNFYSQDPNQHGTSDFGTPSEGTNVETFNSVSGMDQSVENQQLVKEMREQHMHEGNPARPEGESYGTTQEWDVDPNLMANRPDPQPISDEAARKLDEIPDNPSDEALFNRNDATYLEEGDDPNKAYDPHNKGYDDKSDKRSE